MDNTNRAEREQLAHALRVVVRDALDVRAHRDRPGNPGVEDLIYEVTSRLHARHPVRARGLARLRMLLFDGNGPLYRQGHGCLATELRAVLGHQQR
jgi:hypothetical protein